jgi:hypothetical protein
LMPIPSSTISFFRIGQTGSLQPNNAASIAMSDLGTNRAPLSLSTDLPSATFLILPMSTTPPRPPPPPLQPPSPLLLLPPPLLLPPTALISLAVSKILDTSRPHSTHHGRPHSAFPCCGSTTPSLAPTPTPTPTLTPAPARVPPAIP